MKLFSGTAHPDLARQIAQNLGLTIAPSEIVRFANSEVRVRIKDDVVDKNCMIIQPISNPTDTHLIELLFFIDALKRGEAKKISCIIPYFGYARQNIQHRPGEAVSAHVVIQMLEAIGADEVTTIDLHDEATAGVFSIAFNHLSALPLLANEIKKTVSSDAVKIVTPDQGGVERARLFSQAFFGGNNEEIVVVEKKRDLEHIHQSEAIELYGDVTDKTAIIVDDIVTSGGTLLNAAQLCLDKGARAVIAAVTHHDFAAGVSEKLQQSPIEKFFTTDSIALRPEDKFEKLVEISVASLLASSIEG